jgi:hypothetical protein
LADAVAERQKKTASSQVADIVAKPGPASSPSTDTVRTNIVVSRDLMDRVEERMLKLKRAGSPTSWSGLVEVALSEILDRDDLAQVVSRYGLGLRRK